jgi:myo-inositol 2-dehydrogenase / D-chiro-inositol 1-dehydrogenase
MKKTSEAQHTSRREFLKTTSTAAAATTLMSWGSLPGAYAAGSDEIRIGLVGCGGRGTGAAENAIKSAPGVKLVAMGDAFKDRLDGSRAALAKSVADSLAVTDDRCFTGLDAYEKVIASDANYIILATPPGFRPIHLKAAVAAGKNVFTEKPVAVDGPGIRSVLETYEAANAKKVCVVAGTQRRHQTGYVEAMKQIHDGAVGQIVAARCYWNQGSLWKKDRQASWSDLEWQLRNWLYFAWLSGDHIVEQHVHNLDVINWVMRAHPVRAVGMGGRQVRVEPAYGHIFDHFAVDYEYENGAHLMSMCRQIDGCEKNVSEAVVGTRGAAMLAASNRYQITGEKVWSFARQQDNEPYVQEHTDLIESIRAGRYVNELKTVAESTLTAIMGRMSTYTGKAVTWEQAFNSTESLMPAKLEWGPLAVPPVAVPGRTELA